MKRFSLYFYIVAATCMLLASCKPTDPTMEDMFYAEDEATLQSLVQDGKLYTLQQFKDSFMSESGNYLSEQTLYRTRAVGSGTIKGNDTLYLFSLDTIPANGPGIYIMGRVSTDDYGGNFYKSLVIQQIVDNQQQALRISVDAGSVSGMYPRGQMILIRCNGLAIGRYANQPQLCVPSYNNNVFAESASQKVGWAPGRIPLARFKKATKYIGKPDETKLVYDEMTIESITTSYDIVANRKEDGKLIRINNIHYSGEYLALMNKQYVPTTCSTGNPTDDENANVFAPTTQNVNRPQSRLIYDADDAYYIGVSMSEYAKQANYYLPGATAADEGEVYFYDSLAIIDYSQPHLIANLNETLKNCYIPVTARKEYQGWKIDDVVYTDNQKTKGYVCIGINHGEATWSDALGVVHCHEYTGSVKGILSFYMDNATYEPAINNWAISICDLSDLDLTKNGQPWIPLEYTPN